MKKHPAHVNDNVLQQLLHHPKTRLAIFLGLSPADRQMIWLRLPHGVQRDLMENLPNDAIVMLVEAVDPDQANDALRLLSAKRQQQILTRLNERLQEYLRVLSQFDPKTAAGIMDLDYIQVEDTATFADVGMQFKKHEKRTGRPPAVLVVCAGDLLGALPNYELALRKPTEKIRGHILPIAIIAHTAPHRAVMHAFREHPHDKIAVVNTYGHVLGIIYSDDVLRLLNEQESASLLSFAGVQSEESVTDGVQAKVSHRYKWLIINLGTAFFAAFTVGVFEDTIAAHVLLAVYMPLVAGMGGNAATQTLAILVRGIALKQITLRTAWPTIRREIAAGFINGVINGIIVGAVIYALHGDTAIAIVLSLAMVINLVVAGFFGTLIPLIMQRLGKDPATSATIFITTATDVLGFIAFLGLATALLS